MQKKRRISLWLLPIIAFIGMIGALTLNGEPNKRKTKKQQIKNFRKTPEPNYDLLEMHLISELDELQLAAS